MLTWRHFVAFIKCIPSFCPWRFFQHKRYKRLKSSKRSSSGTVKPKEEGMCFVEHLSDLFNQAIQFMFAIHISRKQRPVQVGEKMLTLHLLTPYLLTLYLLTLLQPLQQTLGCLPTLENTGRLYFPSESDFGKQINFYKQGLKEGN